MKEQIRFHIMQQTNTLVQIINPKNSRVINFTKSQKFYYPDFYVRF